MGLTTGPPVDDALQDFKSWSDTGPGVETRGSSSTRNLAGGRRDGFLHERGRAAPSVAVGGQPPDSPARRGAQRAAVSQTRPQDQDYPRWHDAAWAQPTNVRRPRADAREHPRPAADGPGHAQARRRDDGLPLRVPAAPQGVQERASQRRGEADAGSDAPPDPAASIRHGRPRAADAAGRRSGADERAGDARGAVARDRPSASAGAKEGDHAAGSRASALRAVRSRLGHAQGDRGVLRGRADRARGRDRNRERRDHQGPRAHRHGRDDHPVSGGRPRGQSGPLVLRANCRPAARARDRVGAPQVEPCPSPGPRDDEDLRADPRRAQAVARCSLTPRRPRHVVGTHGAEGS